ncbi:alpha/beta fold hydrolase [Nocardioides coralli]|uniref:alpha/beta fold hydrolase n=1 Tax=Nocardioides coralli TaxID=2872154 RepID=UPI001CA39649|nr:alpha/beta hydrolase [Nocardioides coralli]QZY28564.1 alpha/beta hydrolase [Nocardioides coralli]
MSVRRRLIGIAASAAGVAAAGAALGVARQRRIIAHRGAGDHAPFGSLRAKPRTVVTDDGVPLHVEVDELPGSPLTVVFVHGYALNMDCWHFQRAGYRGLVRTVFYDQRSHGRSGRSREGNATIEQVGRDLGQVLDQVGEGPVVLVGHSMGGMSIVALAEERPELFGDTVVGVALISTTAGGLDPHRIVAPLLPSTLGSALAMRTMAVLARGHRTVDGLRRAGQAVATVVTDRFAFGDDVPASYIDFVDEMLSATPFEVIAEFFPTFTSFDKFETIHALTEVPVTIIGGTRDKVTSIGHSRKLASRIPDAQLVECEGAGHMVIMERHEQVNAALDQLLAAAGERVGLS